HAINLHLPADVIANVPFEVDPVVRVLWLVGLIPAFAGVGRLLAAMAIKINKHPIADKLSESVATPVLKADTARDLYAPSSVTERTTNILDHVQKRS
ncbi:MAG TPA: hypothetical protein VE056_07200, partial [Pyrinomonadaceae bacterium]|nr:hypothetical protein [Pyrinomonadaceae bacterium]